MAENLLPPGVIECIRAWKFSAAYERLKNCMEAGGFPEIGENHSADAQFCLLDALSSLAGNHGEPLEGILDTLIDAGVQKLLEGYDYRGPEKLNINAKDLCARGGTVYAQR